MLWKPEKSPFNASSLFPGGDRRSCNDCAALSTSSLYNADSKICVGNRLTRLLEMPWYKSDVARSPNETIIAKDYRIHGNHATLFWSYTHNQSPNPITFRVAPCDRVGSNVMHKMLTGEG